VNPLTAKSAMSYSPLEEFTTLLEAKIMAEDFRRHYNSHRPHSTLNYKTPDEFTLNGHNNNPGPRKILAH
jgi:transposase InsO family protein